MLKSHPLLKHLSVGQLLYLQDAAADAPAGYAVAVLLRDQQPAPFDFRRSGTIMDYKMLVEHAMIAQELMDRDADVAGVPTVPPDMNTLPTFVICESVQAAKDVCRRHDGYEGKEYPKVAGTKPVPPLVSGEATSAGTLDVTVTAGASVTEVAGFLSQLVVDAKPGGEFKTVLDAEGKHVTTPETETKLHRAAAVMVSSAQARDAALKEAAAELNEQLARLRAES